MTHHGGAASRNDRVGGSAFATLLTTIVCLVASLVLACSAEGGVGGPSRGGPSGTGGASQIFSGTGGMFVVGSGGQGFPPPPPPITMVDTTPYVEDETSASGLPPETIQSLKDGGACDFVILYPYGGTVFPVG